MPISEKMEILQNSIILNTSCTIMKVFVGMNIYRNEFESERYFKDIFDRVVEKSDM